MTARDLYRVILEQADHFDWTLQGLGMLRTYLNKSVRMHVWSTAYAYEGVTRIHDHPWDFKSEIISGTMINYLYKSAPGALPFMRQSVKCGLDGRAMNEPDRVELYCYSAKTYRVGETYKQLAHEIHESEPSDGAVTLCERSLPPGADPDLAHVFYPNGVNWVSARPRAATAKEVREITRKALAVWQ